MRKVSLLPYRQSPMMPQFWIGLTNTAAVVIILVQRTTGAETALTALPYWTSADSCAQSCAFFLSSSYSSSASCTSKDVARCLCPDGHSVASVAHDCAATTCWTIHSQAPIFARVLISSYCLVNGFAIARTTAASGLSPSDQHNAAGTTTFSIIPSTKSTKVPSSTNTLSTQSPPPSSTIPTTSQDISPPAILSATTSIATPENAPDAASHEKHFLQRGDIIGIGIGVGVACLLMAGFLYLSKRKRGAWASIGCGFYTGRGTSSKNEDNVLVTSSHNSFSGSDDATRSSGVNVDVAIAVESRPGETVDVEIPSKDSANIEKSTGDTSPVRVPLVEPEPILVYTYDHENSAYPALMRIDTGAEDNFVGNDWLKSTNIDIGQMRPLPPDYPRTWAANKLEMPILGQIELRWSGQYDGKISCSQFNVVDTLSFDMLIGCTTLDEKKVFKRNSQAKALRDKFPVI